MKVHVPRYELVPSRARDVSSLNSNCQLYSTLLWASDESVVSFCSQHWFHHQISPTKQVKGSFLSLLPIPRLSLEDGSALLNSPTLSALTTPRTFLTTPWYQTCGTSLYYLDLTECLEWGERSSSPCTASNAAKIGQDASSGFPYRIPRIVIPRDSTFTESKRMDWGEWIAVWKMEWARGKR